MDEYAWIVWVVIGVFLVIAEVFTPGFVLLWFGVGAFAAALLSFIGMGIGFQLMAFVTVSVALTALSRTIFVKYFSRELTGDDLKTGADSLPGKIGTVVTASSGALNAAEVKVFGSTWRAYPDADEAPLVGGERVTVQRIDGASIYVRRTQDLAEWRGAQAEEPKKISEKS